MSVSRLPNDSRTLYVRLDYLMNDPSSDLDARLTATNLALEITDLAALWLPPKHRLFPRAFAWGKLGGCLFLAVWVETAIWASGIALLGLGFVGRAVLRRLAPVTASG